MQKVTARVIDKSFIVGEAEDKPVDLLCILEQHKDKDIEMNNNQDVNLMGYGQETYFPVLSLNVSSYFMRHKGKVTQESSALKNSSDTKTVDAVESFVRVIKKNKIRMNQTLYPVLEHVSHSVAKESDIANLAQLKINKESSIKQFLPLSISEVTDRSLFKEINAINSRDISGQYQTVSNMPSDSQGAVLNQKSDIPSVSENAVFNKKSDLRSDSQGTVSDKKSGMTVNSQLTMFDTKSDIKEAEVTEQINVGGDIKTVILHNSPLGELAQKPVADQQVVKQAAPVMKTIPWTVSEKASGHEQVTEIGSGKLTYTFHERASDSVKITYSNVAGQGTHMLISPSNSDVHQQLQNHWPTGERESNWLLKDRQHQSKQQTDHEEEEE